MENELNKVMGKMVDKIFFYFGIVLFVIGILGLFEFNPLINAIIKGLPIAIGACQITTYYLEKLFKKESD